MNFHHQSLAAPPPPPGVPRRRPPLIKHNICCTPPHPGDTARRAASRDKNLKYFSPCTPGSWAPAECCHYLLRSLAGMSLNRISVIYLLSLPPLHDAGLAEPMPTAERLVITSAASCTLDSGCPRVHYLLLSRSLCPRSPALLTTHYFYFCSLDFPLFFNFTTHYSAQTSSYACWLLLLRLKKS